MRYLPTLDLWNNAIHTAVVTGQLRLIPGQWIQCGAGRKSRFIDVSDHGVINAVHWSGSGKATRDKFILRAAMAKIGRQQTAGTITTKQARDMAWAL